MTIPDNLTSLVELASNVAGSFSAVLYVTEPGKNTLKLRASISLSSSLDENAVFSFGKGAIGRVAQTREPFLLEKVADDRELLIPYKQPVEIRAFMAMPVGRNEVLGVLALDTREPFAFNAKLEKIMSGFADQMALRLNYEKEIAAKGEDEVFPYSDAVHFIAALSGSQSPATIADRLTHLPKTLLEYDAAAVIWFEKPGAPGKAISHRGWDGPVSEYEIHLGRGAAGSCAKNQTPLLIENAPGRKSVLFVENEKLGGFPSRLTVPVTSEGRLFAVLAYASRSRQGMTQRSLNRASLIAALAASVLESAETNRRGEYEKNIDSITRLPNHRFLSEYRFSIEKELLERQSPLHLTMVRLKNLPFVYESHGVEIGDKLLCQVASILSRTAPSPKNIFKYTDSAFLILLARGTSGDADHLETRLKMVFEENKVIVEGKPVSLSVGIGSSSYPGDGKTLGELIGTCWARTNQEVKVLP